MDDYLFWTSTLFRSFYAEGVRHVFISPGSRSTPLVLAAALHPGLDQHVVLDERSAAFQALGVAKATGKPPLLICTSGTAPANYYPAIIEAHQSGVPLVVISADRPPHLRATGSSQTIDQMKLFGDHVLLFHELGEPVNRPEDLHRLTQIARQAWILSTETGGPVHLNAPFRKPLEPDRESIEKEKEKNVRQWKMIQPSETDQSPNPRQRETVHQRPARESGSSENRDAREFLPPGVIHALNRSNRPLLFAGPDESSRSARKPVQMLAAHLNLPILAEPGSHLDGGLHRCDPLLRSILNGRSPGPDLILRVGDETISPLFRDVEAAFPEIPVIQLLTRQTWQDSRGRVDHRIRLRYSGIDLQGLEPKPPEWLRSWTDLESRADRAFREILRNSRPLTDGHVCYHVSKLFQSGWSLMTSNSFPVRDLSLFGAAGTPLSEIYVNRGSAGIDGILSTAAGINIGSRQKTALLIGDLAFIHDSGTLRDLSRLQHPMVVVVLNNGGGTIFRMLPVSDQTDYFTDYFETPQQVRISDLVRAHDLDYRLIDSREELEKLTPESFPLDRPLIIECRTHADESMKLRRTLWNTEGESPEVSATAPNMASRSEQEVTNRK